jgi:membrane protein YqaA with SNARE-associated domain
LKIASQKLSCRNFFLILCCELIMAIIMEWLSDYGYWGVFGGSFLAATVVPFSSEALVAALLAAGGDIVATIVVASLGNWLGGLTSYWVGRAGNWQLIERWFHISREKLERQQSKIDRWRSWIALMTWLPFVGDIFAVGLGFYKINFWSSALLMFVGKTLRFVVCGVAYYYFDQWLF